MKDGRSSESGEEQSRLQMVYERRAKVVRVIGHMLYGWAIFLF